MEMKKVVVPFEVKQFDESDDDVDVLAGGHGRSLAVEGVDELPGQALARGLALAAPNGLDKIRLVSPAAVPFKLFYSFPLIIIRPTPSSSSSEVPVFTLDYIASANPSVMIHCSAAFFTR